MDKPCSNWARLILFFAFSAFCFSCKKNNNSSEETKQKGPKIAMVFDKDVFAGEINIWSKKDSALIVSEYLDRIAENEALYLKANESGFINKEEIEEKTNRFRKSLISLAYENSYIKQNLDTNITEADMKKYYDLNSSLILLRTNIFKGYYVVLPISNPKNARIKELMLSDKLLDIQELNSLCIRYSSAYSIEHKTWSAIPSQINLLFGFNEATVNQYIRNRQILVLEKEDNLYLVRVFDFKFARQPSPFSYSKQEIKCTLLNKRKMDLLTQLKQQLLVEAKSNKKIEIY